ncbi:MAG: hypothetical protein L6R40_003433 [Gallowayella cf. fulva]|nr:MAG: hypothetical protein L6R40_003433 [Xanthomendoza cf. fulva]
MAPPPPPPHPPHPAMSPGIHALPVEFHHLNLGPAMPPHHGHQHVRPPSAAGIGDLSPEFDTGLLRKEKDLYEGYNFERLTPQQPNEKATWALVTKTRMPIGQNELRAMVDKQKRKSPSAAWNLLKSDEMKGFKRKQVDQLISDRTAADPRFKHELVGLKLDQNSDRRGNRSTTAFQVILKRQLRKDLSNAASASLGTLHEPHREVVDLTAGSQDSSEGSQDFPGGNSPPPHFMPPPHHGFPDHHGFEHQFHQPPFAHHPGPPMHEVPHEAHHGPPPQHHMPHHPMPQFEDPYMHRDLHQAHPPPPAPFPPHMLPNMPPLEGHKGKPKEAKDAKHSKGSKDMKPKIHQEKPSKLEKQHRKAHSESDWDYFSESSSSSKAYTDRSPDTVYSSNSSRKDSKRHGRKDSRRSSHGHHDDFGSGRQEPVYRVHRRKPIVSPDRSWENERARYRVEEIEVIPASNARMHRPYLARSRTSVQRPERLVEHSERPAFRSRHLSYDDDGHHDLRGLTPPGRRGPVYTPLRSLAVDLYDHREEQELMEREEVRQELLREGRRKEELRESVARQLEREAEERRRRDRAMSRDLLYDERPRRRSRGYDNDRYAY